MKSLVSRLRSIMTRSRDFNSELKKLEKKGIIRYDPLTNSYIRDIFGNSFHLSPNDQGLSRELALKGIREAESTEMMMKLIKPNMTVIDIGANIGYYVLLEANAIKKGDGKIIAIEPHPENIKYLKFNVERNSLQHCVNIIEGAITNTDDEKVELVVSSYGNCHHLKSVSSRPTEKAIEVQAYTFEEMIKIAELPLEKIDFIRMDIEGAEYLILPTFLDLLSKMESIYMFIEFHPHVNLELHKATLIKLEKIGFKTIDVTKESVVDGVFSRQHIPNATIKDLYTNEYFMQFGGCETFLFKV